MLIEHRFTKNIPVALEKNVLYISMEYGSAIHLCVCGCGNQVVTPLSPYDWQLLYDGETVSLNPSIGNWNFPCQSHYWIINSEIEWAPKWSREKIEKERQKDEEDRARNVKRFDSWGIFRRFRFRKKK